VVTTPVEHKAVLAAAHQAAAEGADERLLAVDADGVVDLASAERALGADVRCAR
jgi:cysteine desulfurase